jgi:hypothetical protein
VGRSESDRIDESDEVGANVARASGLVTAVDEPGMSSSGRRPPRLAAGHAALILRIGAEEQDRPGALWGSPRASDALVVETTEVPVGIALTHLPSVVGRASASVTLMLVASGILVAGGPKSGQPSPNGGASRGLVPGSPRPAARAEPGDPGAGLEISETRSMQKQIMGVAALGAALAIGDASHAQAVQWRVGDGGNGHWYAIHELPNRPTCTAAELIALAAGARLIGLETAQEAEFFRILRCSMGKQHLSAWQDLRRVGGEWMWGSGATLGFQSWSPGQPDFGDTATIDWSGPSGQCDTLTWGDEICDVANLPSSIFLEWSADCNNDGIVDYGQCRDGSLPDYNGNNVPDCCETGQACAVGNYPVQWRVTDGGNGRWYKIQLTEQPLLWTAAREIAGAFGGQLLSVNTAGEQTAMEALLRAAKDSTGCHPAVFIGLSKRPGVPWRWEDGSELSYENWACGEPFDPDYPEGKVVMYNPAACEDYCVPHLRWNDVSQLVLHPLHRGVAIEWSADCNADGIVDYGQILQGHLPDTNGNGVPDACEVLTCANADLFRDSNINGADLGILLAQWGEANAQTVSDINRDGAVDGVDLGLLLSFWGPCPN